MAVWMLANGLRWFGGMSHEAASGHYLPLSPTNAQGAHVHRVLLPRVDRTARLPRNEMRAVRRASDLLAPRPRVVDSGRCGMTVDTKARTEDIRWMVATGENLEGAARRLNISQDGVDAWCKKNNLAAEASILRSRNPADHNYHAVVAMAGKRWAS